MARNGAGKVDVRVAIGKVEGWDLAVGSNGPSDPTRKREKKVRDAKPVPMPTRPASQSASRERDNVEERDSEKIAYL